jgi:hypothetical protein
MNESHLDPDLHLWPECPDDRCSRCGKEFPADAEIDEESPMYEGFCSEECAKHPIPPTIRTSMGA